MQVVCPTAVRFVQDAVAETAASTASATLGIGEDAVLLWKPRARDASREVPRSFAEISSAYRIDASLIEGRHGIVLRIAQGELREIACTLPPGCWRASRAWTISCAARRPGWPSDPRPAPPSRWRASSRRGNWPARSRPCAG
jgi:hypothetical protein